MFGGNFLKKEALPSYRFSAILILGLQAEMYRVSRYKMKGQDVMLHLIFECDVPFVAVILYVTYRIGVPVSHFLKN